MLAEGRGGKGGYPTTDLDRSFKLEEVRLGKEDVLRCKAQLPNLRL
jgi:hypothetical protein